MASDPRVGTEFASYRVESVLGRGGMGVVYLAEDTRLGRKVALKLLPDQLAEDERFRSRFVRESRLAASIDHPNVTPVYEAGEADGVLFIAMRHVRGTDLRTVIDREAPLETSRVGSIVAQVAAALDAAHAEGLVHRDVKPANVLLAEGDHVYLSDFGLTKRTTSGSGLTLTGQFVGTVDYVAPEQIEGGDVDGRADVYSLGCVTYECLTRAVPFDARTDMGVLWAHAHRPPPKVTERRPDLPPGIDAVVARAMAKRPESRHPTAGELAADVRAVLAPPGAERAARPPPRPPGRRRRLLVAAGTLAAVVAGTVTAIVLSAGGEGPSPPAGTSTAAGTNRLVRLDPSTEKVTDTIPLPPSPFGGRFTTVEAGQGGLWVDNGKTKSLTHVDPAHREVEATIPMANTAGFVDCIDLAVTEGAEGAVWASGCLPDERLAVFRIDAATNRVVGDTRIGRAGGLPEASTFAPITPLVLASGEGSVWALHPPSGTVLGIDPGTNDVVARARIDDEAATALVAGEGAVWVGSAERSVVYKIDPRTAEVVAEVAVVGGADELAVGDGAVWALSNHDGTLIEIDPRADEAVRSFKVGRNPTDVAVSGDGAWVTDRTEGRLYRVNTTTGEVGSIELGDSPEGVAIDEGAVWVAIRPSGQL